MKPNEVLVKTSHRELVLLELWHAALGMHGELDLVLL